MITCKELAELISDYIDGSLDPSISNDFDSHIEGCIDCHAFLKTYKKTTSLSHQLSCEEIPKELRDRLSTLLKKRRKN